jgi:hypothetical protein
MARIDFDISKNKYIRISDSNSLRWIRTDIQSGFRQNKDDYNIYDNEFPNIIDYFVNFFQEYKIGTNIFNQFAIAVDFDTITKIELYNIDGTLHSDLTAGMSISKGPEEKQVYGNITWYNHIIDTSLLGGCYYVLISTNLGQTFRSESLHIHGMEDKYVIYVQYRNNVAGSVFDDGIYYDGINYPGFYIPGNIYDAEPGGEQEIYHSFNFQPIMLSGKPLRFDILNYGPVQWWFWEKLNLAKHHDVFFVNSKEYVTPVDLEKENIENSLYVKGSLRLQLKDYQNYVILEDIPEEDAETLSWDGNDVISWDGNDEISIK